MSRTIQIAAIQMEVNPAPTPERLARAEKLVTGATQAGAQLVVLPELFNTGYIYTDENFARAEQIDGPTVGWMQAVAARLGVHLAGSLLLFDESDIYNALLLVAPDGRAWRYDKSYPWGWERRYFRPGQGAVVAHTALGDIGLMICWDVAHPNLWRSYAGQVDLMLISSCPPNIPNPTYSFPNGEQVKAEDMGPRMVAMKDAGRWVFEDTLHQQTAWLGVPAVNTVACGRFRSPLPTGRLSLLSFLPAAPRLAKYLPQADQIQMSCEMIQACKIVNAHGQIVAERLQEQGEGFALGEVALPDQKPAPAYPQPKPPIPWITYLLPDHILPPLMVPAYRVGLRRAWGVNAAPIPPNTRRWAFLLIALAGVGLLLSRRDGPSRLQRRRRKLK